MPSVNSKADKHVNCWLCDHFQRYDRSSSPQSCVGECRYNAPDGIISGNFGGAGISEFRFFPVIEDSPNVWCAKFERTREKNLPPVPPQTDIHGTQSCENSAVLPDEWETFFFAPWNKKILPGYVDEPKNGISCLKCDNFQIENPDRGDSGYCRFHPPGSYRFGDALANFTDIQSSWAPFSSSHCYWCSQWQRHTYTFVEPSGFTWECPQNQQELTAEEKTEALKSMMRTITAVDVEGLPKVEKTTAEPAKTAKKTTKKKSK